MKKTLLGIVIGFVACIVLIFILASTLPGNNPADHHEGLMDVYYPGTEELGPNEMRVIALGTGMPNARPKQAAACWLVELGNGDKFLFDCGTGSAERLSAMKIPYNLVDKVFIGHLHSDHFGDLDALYCGGIVANRVVPLKVWGPSSETPEYGFKAAWMQWRIC